VGISPSFGEISKGLVERVGSLPLAFHAFHSPGISTAHSGFASLADPGLDCFTPLRGSGTGHIHLFGRAAGTHH
jgi:hypothetical protein